MPKLPLLSAQQAGELAESQGYEFDRQSGSHLIYVRSEGDEVSIPKKRQLKRGTQRAIMKQIGITRQQLTDWLSGNR